MKEIHMLEVKRETARRGKKETAIKRDKETAQGGWRSVRKNGVI